MNTLALLLVLTTSPNQVDAIQNQPVQTCPVDVQTMDPKQEIKIEAVTIKGGK